MDRTLLLKRVAPCSLLCDTCSGYQEGIIPELAGRLGNYFQGFPDFLSQFDAAGAEEFRRFQERLNGFAHPDCGGCRDNPDCRCSIEGCIVLDCTHQHQVDYCGECREFPCTELESIFSPTVYRRWKAGSARIAAVGVEQFYEEMKDTSHYADYLPKNCEKCE